MKKKLIPIKSCRRGDAAPFPYKTGRIYSVGNEWYFTTREGFEQGPYSSKKRAEAALAEFLALCLFEYFDGSDTIQVSRQSDAACQAETAKLDAMTNELLQYFQIREVQGPHAAIEWARGRSRLLRQRETAESVDHQAKRVEALEYIVEEEKQGHVYLRQVYATR